MKPGSTIILRGFVVLIGLIVLAVCALVLPRLINSELEGDFDYGLIFLGMYVPAVPFFYALYQTWKLLNYIDQSKAFSELSVKALRKVKYCALAISGLYAVGMPYIFYVADRDDAPGVVAMALLIIGTSFVIATSAAVLQTLVQHAVDIKSENDLTV